MPVLAAKRLCWIVTGGLLAGAPALAQTPQERAWCEGEDAVSVDQRIDGCSAVIKAGRDRSERLAETFNSRGIAYRLKGDYDRAIQDYSQAIKLNPKFAVAYNNRGVAHERKSEYDRRITTKRSSSSPPLRLTSTAATRSWAGTATITPSMITTRRSGSNRISLPPLTTDAGRGRWSAFSSRRSPTATKRSG